ncbi:DUF3379 family protein [Rheinheimera sp.]|uniref:DUF3379 family protein n=1 Tax=Rheinheimera sp. TaxID=1869214 RepID=UPI0027B99A41|nr:DUF3379 family protein [Rheinheimera sp.]
MDELEFRRRLFSDPKAGTTELQQALQQDEAKKQLQQELLQLDTQLLQAMQVGVPHELADRLMFNQQLAGFRQQKRRRQWTYGIAAAVALTAGLVQLRFEFVHFGNDLGSYALAHVYHEASALVSLNEQLPMATVNALMADFAGKLDGFDGQVHYARFCNFRGVRALHLILKTQDGPVTVFVLPKDHGWQPNQGFADDNFHGQSLALAGADLVLVAAKQQQLTPLADKLQQQFSFNPGQRS